ncbi:MAG: reverse gyrase [Eggerthellaceae bacterium]|nr:reverse gyrase [Eggerthellaceae bacterium]
MRRCDFCRIDVEGSLDRCPLCGSELTGTPTPDPFPNVAQVRQNFRIEGLLGTVTLVLCLLVVPLLIAGLVTWLEAVAIVGVLLVNYLFLRNILTHATNTLRMAERYFFVLLAMALLAYLATQLPVISSFIVPLLCIVALVANGVLLIVYGGAFVEGYAKYLIMDMILGAVPLLLVVVGQSPWPWLAWISAALALLLLLALLLGTRRQFTSESRKFFDRG